MARAASSLLDDFSNTVRQHVHLERFGHYEHAIRKAGLPDHGVLSVAGYEQYLQVWTIHPRRIRNLSAVHSAGKTDIRYQQINPGVRIEHLEACWTIRRLDDSVAGLR